MLLQAITNGQMQTPRCVQGILLCFCKLFQMARYRLHSMLKVYPCAFESYYKWPNTDSTLCARYIHVLLHCVTNNQKQTPHSAQILQAVTNDQIQTTHCAQGVTNGQIQTTYCAQCISMCCCKLLQMARYRNHIELKVYPCAIARCFKRPDTDPILCARYIHMLLHCVTNGQIQTPHCAHRISM